jgi:O-antigen/teichoic acid export membrane protein
VADLLRRAGGWVRPPGQRHLRTFASLTAATQGEAVLSFLSTVALIRVTGTVESGRVFFAQSLAGVWFMLWDPKFDDAAQRFVPLHQATAQGRGTWLFVRLLRLDVAVGLFAAAVGAGGVALARGAGWFDADQALFLLLALLAAGIAAPIGTAGAGFAVVGQLGRLGLLRSAAAAMSFVATVTALITAGSVAFLVTGVLTGLVTTTLLSVAARRAIIDVLGPPPPGPIPLPDGIVRFAAKSSAATSVGAASERGVLTLAGFLVGPSLVTFLKVAGSAGRLYVGFVSSAAAQMYPRITSAAVLRDLAGIRRDTQRIAVLLALLGLVTVIAMAPLAGPALTIVYGPAYGWLAGVTMILVLASCVRGTVVWGKVFPLALGRPGVLLAFVIAEGVLVLAAVLISAWCAGTPERAVLIFAWADVSLAVARTTTWLILLRILTREPAA